MDTILRVREHYEIAKAFVPEERIIGVFLYGAQNYNMADELSDVDTKCLYVPSFDELIFPNTLVNKDRTLENGEHITFIDIRNFMRSIRMSDPMLMEALFTDYFILGPCFEELWNDFISYREAISRFQPYAFVNVAYHMMNGVIKKQDKFGYNPKYTALILRFEAMIKDYIDGISLKIAYAPAEASFLKQVKRGLYSKEENDNLAQKALARAKKMVEDYTSLAQNKTNEEALWVIEKYQKEFIRFQARKELLDD